MKTVLLLRHGQAQEGGGQEDKYRNLTEKGTGDAKSLGEKLAHHGFHPEIIFSSSAYRTQQTGEAIKTHFDGLEMVLTDDLYNASPLEIIEFIEAIPESYSNIIVVAHNPGISMCYNQLSGDDQYFAPGEGAILDVDIASWQELETGDCTIAGRIEHKG